MTPSVSCFHDIRGLRYHVRIWGPDDAPLVVMLHGWMDVGASFQFLVDSFARTWRVVAPDWRGFGRTAWADGTYWFPDYYADLDRLLDIVAPHAAVNLLGHSMGGNIACTYAGIRPDRVARLVSLEGFGPQRHVPGDAPARYRRWLDEIAGDPPRFRPYASFEEVAERIRKRSTQLTPERARFLARHWARQQADGSVVLVSDPRHRLVNPVLSRIEELLACWRCVTAPTFWIRGTETDAMHWQRDDQAQFAERTACFRDFRTATIQQAGHMMHHDQPEVLAGLVEPFLARN